MKQVTYGEMRAAIEAIGLGAIHYTNSEISATCLAYATHSSLNLSTASAIVASVEDRGVRERVAQEYNHAKQIPVESSHGRGVWVVFPRLEVPK